MDAKTLAPGDVVLLEGSLVPADGHLLTCIELSVDESALNGESIAVLKQTDAVSEQAALADRHDRLPRGVWETTPPAPRTS